MLWAQSEGLHHQAMGFRIALARCFRRMGMLTSAETILDAVHNDLLRYGCSERTFLTFLNEAGRVLIGRGDPIRAYATYLRPCIGRAKARGFRRDAEQAASAAREALKEIRDACEKHECGQGPSGTGWADVLATAKAGHRKLLADSEKIYEGRPLGRDPLYAYAIADAEKIIDGLASCLDVDRHIAEIENEIRPAA
jgi:hypothetical protein